MFSSKECERIFDILLVDEDRGVQRETEYSYS